MTCQELNCTGVDVGVAFGFPLCSFSLLGQKILRTPAAVKGALGLRGVSEPLTARTALRDSREEGKACFGKDRTSRRSRKLLRRLISLIFAGRNRIIVIRRELPRTKIRESGKSRSHRTFEGSPFPCAPELATGSVLTNLYILRQNVCNDLELCGRTVTVALFCVGSDGPDEAE